MKKISALLLSVVLLLALGACGTPPSSGGTAPPADDAGAGEPAGTQPPADTTVTDDTVEIHFWDLRTEAGALEMIEKIIASFEAEYPNITVVHTSFRNEDLRNTIKPAITSGEGPDIFSYESGAGYLGVLASSGLALELDAYVDQYNWEDRFHDWALEKTLYNGGKQYGIANELELLGVFYNKQMFADNGVDKLPDTYEEFLAICDIFKDQGVTPVVLDDQDMWPGFHYESIWLNSFAGPEKVTQAIQGKIPWNSPDLCTAMDQFQQFVQDGYTSEAPLSLTYDDANSLFYADNGGAMRITGTWMVDRFIEEMGDNVGFFYLPPGSSDVTDCAPGGLGEAVVINANSSHANEAALFLDFMFNDDMVTVWYEYGLIPSVKDVDYTQFNLPVLFREIVDEINESEEMGENIDVLMPPKVNDVTQTYMQQIIAGTVSGQDCMDMKQAAFEEDIADGNYVIED